MMQTENHKMNEKIRRDVVAAPVCMPPEFSNLSSLNLLLLP